MDIKSKFKLNNDVEMPVIGLGTYKLNGEEMVEKAVHSALETGYRLIDTARNYGNEKEVGEAIKSSGIDRKEIFITTKLDNDEHGYDKTLTAFNESLERMQLDYIDLFLIHWPSSNKYVESWKAMEKLLDDGKVKSIGVSNFTKEHLNELLNESGTVPAVNQYEFNPFVHQKDIYDFCEEKGIITEAYAPIARAKRFDDEDVQKISEKHSKTPAQIILRWSLQKDCIVIPKSKSPDRIKENADIFDFELDENDIQKLNNKHEDLRVAPDPHGM